MTQRGNDSREEYRRASSTEPFVPKETVPGMPKKARLRVDTPAERNSHGDSHG